MPKACSAPLARRASGDSEDALASGSVVSGGTGIVGAIATALAAAVRLAADARFARAAATTCAALAAAATSRAADAVRASRAARGNCRSELLLAGRGVAAHRVRDRGVAEREGLIARQGWAIGRHAVLAAGSRSAKRAKGRTKQREFDGA